MLSTPKPPGVEGGVKDEAPTELGADIPSSCWSSLRPTVGEREIGGAGALPPFPSIFIYRIFSHFEVCVKFCANLILSREILMNLLLIIIILSE